MQYIVGFNGPPKCGKDTVAQALRSMMDVECNIPTLIDHLARPMREMAMSLVGVNPKDFRLYNEIKDKPQSLLKTALRGDEDSIRRLMIRTSEDFIKPTYGRDFWARKLAQDHPWIEQGLPGVLIIPDIGFPDEVGYLDSLREKLPPLNTLIVQLSRPGVTWELDSRIPCRGKWHNKSVVNNSQPVDAAGIVLDHMVKHLGWNLSCGA